MPDGNPQSRRVCLIGWDAADWKMIEPLLEKGFMPNLQKLIDNGVMGNVASLSPMLSPILWTSIATGKHADKHNILGFAEPNDVGSGMSDVNRIHPPSDIKHPTSNLGSRMLTNAERNDQSHAARVAGPLRRARGFRLEKVMSGTGCGSGGRVGVRCAPSGTSL